jgi:hypothetical protein
MIFPCFPVWSPSGTSGLSQNSKSAFEPEGKMNKARARAAANTENNRKGGFAGFAAQSYSDIFTTPAGFSFAPAERGRATALPKNEKPPAGHRWWFLEVYQKVGLVSPRLSCRQTISSAT